MSKLRIRSAAVHVLLPRAANSYGKGALVACHACADGRLPKAISVAGTSLSSSALSSARSIASHSLHAVALPASHSRFDAVCDGLRHLLRTIDDAAPHFELQCMQQARALDYPSLR